MNNLALMNLISRESYRQGSSAELMVEHRLIQLTQELGLSLDKIVDAVYSQDAYAIFVP